MNREVQIALLLDSPNLEKWQWRAINELMKDDELIVNVRYVVINQVDNENSIYEKIKSFIFNFSPWKALLAYRMIFFGKPCYRRSIHISETVLSGNAEKIECSPIPAEEFGNKLPPNVIEKLSSVDLAIRFGFGILQGNVLSSPKHGVLSYHNGDLSEYRGKPAGFYEFIHNNQSTGVTIQILNESLDAGDIAAFQEVYIDDATSLREVRSRQFSVAPELLPEAVKNCITGDIKQQFSLGDLYTMPSNNEMIRYFIERLRRTLKRYLDLDL